MQLANQTVVILGGSSGIGLATAQAACPREQISSSRAVRASDSRRRARYLGGNARTVTLDTVDEDGTGCSSMNSFTWISSSSRR